MEYEYEVQGDYGYGDGWESLCAENTEQEAVNRLYEYQDNEPGIPFRVRRVRVSDERA